MLTEERSIKKLAQIEKRYQSFRFVKVVDIPMELCETAEYHRNEPIKGNYRPAPIGTRWGDVWMSGWFHGEVTLPKECQNKTVYIRAKTGAPESMLIVDGEHKGVFDHLHPVVTMTLKGKANQKHEKVLHRKDPLIEFSLSLISGLDCRDGGLPVHAVCQPTEYAVSAGNREE